ncbi:hypothetical protein QFZ63_001553 [Streptomyces sp. B3I7]|nr:hypothetical protein [Streptomyces sp. B3I7]
MTAPPRESRPDVSGLPDGWWEETPAEAATQDRDYYNELYDRDEE